MIDAANKATYARADVVKFYLNVDELLKAERVLFGKLSSVIRDSRVLDIGVGGGRTTPHLLMLTDDYTGIDYVKEFAEEAAKKFPAAKIIQADATDMKAFEAGSFDFVLFSYNGLDSLTNEARLKVISEVHRVLTPGGTFMFSSHNLDYEHFNKLPWQRKFHFNKKYIVFFLHCLYHMPNHYRMKKHEVYADDYAIINDGDHRYSLMLYYIRIPKQIEQLERAGFAHVEAHDMDGEIVESDTRSHWIHYVAVKG